MNNINLKTVALWGFLILLAHQVLGLLIMGLVGSSSLTIIVSWVLALVIATALSYKSAKSVLEGLLEGIVAAALAMLVASFLSNGQNNFVTLVLILVGCILGGFLASKKK